MKKEIRICFMSKSGNCPRGIYAFRNSNIWYPVIYFRKSKHADSKLYEILMKYVERKFKEDIK